MEEDSSPSFFPSLQHSRTRKTNTSSRPFPWRWEMKKVRQRERDFVLFLSTWEWLQNYWEWHWKHSDRKKNHPSTHPKSDWLQHGLCPGRLGRDVSSPCPWAGSGTAEEGDLRGAAALPSLALTPPHPLSSVPHSSTARSAPAAVPFFTSPPSPADIGIPAADPQQSKRGGRGVWPAETLKGWTSTALNCRGCVCWKPRAKFSVMSKDSAFLLTFLNSQHHHNGLAKFRRNSFKMWE